MSEPMRQIQATITGYGGSACTLFSAYDPSSRVLVVSALTACHMERRAGCIMLTNVPDLPRDTLFTDADLMPALAAFHALKAGVAADGAGARLVFSERAARANPAQSIERDGIDASGPKYRVAPDMTCAQVAALATCLYAGRSDTVERAVALSESLRSLLAAGHIVTV